MELVIWKKKIYHSSVLYQLC